VAAAAVSRSPGLRTWPNRPPRATAPSADSVGVNPR
jgi:hypothetical protein